MNRPDFEYDDPNGRCADCGHELDQASERCCSIGELELCSTCAGRRGGTYDSDQDRWTQLPDVADLLEPRRPIT